MYHESETNLRHSIGECVTESATESRPNRTSFFRKENSSDSFVDLSEPQEIFSIEMRADLAGEVAEISIERIRRKAKEELTSTKRSNGRSSKSFELYSDSPPASPSCFELRVVLRFFL
jgi:hypothetical protein